MSGNRTAFLASLSPAEQEREDKRVNMHLQMENKSLAEYQAEEAASVSNALLRLVETHIVEERVDSPDRVTLRVRWVERNRSDGGSWMEKEFNFQKIGNEWKLDDGL